MTAEPASDAGGDSVLPFQIEGLGIRGRLVRLRQALEPIILRHAYPLPVAGLLAETLAMAAVLASGLKYDGIFTLQLQGDGPVPLIICDVTSEGDVRGYARFDEGRLVTGQPAGEPPVPRLLGAGHMVFTVDQGPATERYQGVTPLEGATLGECCHAYFRRSEQLATALLLGSTGWDGKGGAPRAAALMLQRLPGRTGPGLTEVEEDDWRRAVVLMSSLSLPELLAANADDNEILYRLFHEDGVRVYRRRRLRHRCRCSQRKVERTLVAFPREEMRTMLVDGVLTVTCEFCKATYVLDEKALDRLYAGSA